jgi:hypothetical protein
VQGFPEFRLLVLSDLALQEELRAIPDSPALFARVLELGRRRGYDFSEQDLQAAANANQRAWLERWLHQ